MVALFARLMTQWRMGPSGPVGLDYGVLPLALDADGLADGNLTEILDDLQVMENAALDEIYANMKRSTK